LHALHYLLVVAGVAGCGIGGFSGGFGITTGGGGGGFTDTCGVLVSGLGAGTFASSFTASWQALTPATVTKDTANAANLVLYGFCMGVYLVDLLRVKIAV
jgi:hypothetical protein